MSDLTSQEERTPRMDSLEARPPILYKYYPPERLDILENWSVRFTSPAEFNDVFDTYAKGKTLAAKAGKSIFRAQLGVFCMTSDPNNHLMWVNYASQHRGFVVGFNTNEEPFDEPSRTLRKVAYVDGPSGLDALDVYQTCYYKGTEWAYEKEWRCVQLSEKTKSRDAEITPLSIAEIIVGSKMHDGHLVSLLQTVRNIEEVTEIRIPIRRSKPLLGQWQFTHEPLERRVCSECEGTGHTNVGLGFARARAND